MIYHAGKSIRALVDYACSPRVETAKLLMQDLDATLDSAVSELAADAAFPHDVTLLLLTNQSVILSH